MERRDILIVDDDRQVREVLHQIFLGANYKCLLANDGHEGLEGFRASRPPLTVTDLKMPVMGGIELLQHIRQEDPDAAVIVLTGAADVKTAIASLQLGAYDFIMKPVNVDELLIAADRALERRQLLLERRQYQELLERRVVEATHDLEHAYRQLQDTYRTTLEALGSALDTRDVGTESHSRRVHGYAMATAREYGVPEKDLADLAHGVLLHDIGKIGIPDAILLKPGPLSADEMSIMKTHAAIGARTLMMVYRQYPSNAYIAMGMEIARSHHERWDGRGYPDGLAGEAIPLSARIMSLVDVYDALCSDRCYKKAVPKEAALAMIQEGAGTQFDPRLARLFVSCGAELGALWEKCGMILDSADGRS